ncbi:uncharacterized protein TRUGW13939_02046 [Talaromyces rugulosus]|uniref:Major facilitator superfamily (MFS) profile domain-containing protein n=1 Tax=Talaromyces rugulosus TaxID=121627 RepID=A0A7H8QM47_TALRU|nr:uncharacterized protein TRUGW13939_02046 [Talaromyces rugulosus]QKX54956.1 hypothetical protein TRUGW13939_02046 [Talaromyces rugulosus]
MPLGIIQVDGQHAPGTFLLINQTAGDDLFQTKHDTSKKADVILVPQPSDSPNDPLNWPPWKKNLAYAVIFANSIIYASIPAPLIAPSTVLLSQSLGRSIKDVSMLTAYQLLVCACYGPIASALAHKYGKRPQFIFGAVMGLVGTIVCCTTTHSYSVLLAGRIIQGIGSSVFESLSMAVIGDLRTFSDTNLFKLVFAPFGVLLNPAVIWFTIVGSVCIALYVALSYILAQIWSPPPYNLNARQNGTFYVGALIGGLLSSTVSPWVGDIIASKMTKWNKGVYEPEFRIPMIIFATLFCGIGWFVFMWDLDNPTPHGYYLGAFCHGCLCAGTTIGMTVASLYALSFLTLVGCDSDSCRESSTEIFVLAMASKNFLFYGFSEFINDWTERNGPHEVLRTFGIVTMCIMATSLVLYIFGKVNRCFMHKVGLMNKLMGYQY